MNAASSISRFARYCASNSQSMAVHKVFVYGTLKKGEPNHQTFNSENGQWNFFSNGTTVEKYPLIIGTKYNIPFLLYSPGNGTHVKGEIYEVDNPMLETLDILEEHPTFYEREVHPVLTANNETVNCWIYFLKKFRPQLLNQTHYENYNSKGSHGLVYIERYLRENNQPAKNEVFLD